jgi:hypothetical protein
MKSIGQFLLKLSDSLIKSAASLVMRETEQHGTLST